MTILVSRIVPKHSPILELASADPHVMLPPDQCSEGLVAGVVTRVLLYSSSSWYITRTYCGREISCVPSTARMLVGARLEYVCDVCVHTVVSMESMRVSNIDVASTMSYLSVKKSPALV